MNPHAERMQKSYKAAGGKNMALPWDMLLDFLIDYIRNMCPTVEGGKRFAKRHPDAAKVWLASRLKNDVAGITAKDANLVAVAGLEVLETTSANKIKEMM